MRAPTPARGAALLVLFTLFLAANSPAQVRSFRGLDPKLQAELDARCAEYNDLMARARRAEARKDYIGAEAALSEACSALHGSDDPFAHFDLAAFYDRRGRDREAFAEYRVALKGRENSWSSRQEDPRILARYGDLCLSYSTPEEAAQRYAFAATRSSRDDFWEPRTTPRGSSLPSLRAAAHAAAAIECRGCGDDERALRELRAAIAADPAYWVPHFYAALWLVSTRREEAAREADLAERLAPDAPHREIVRRMRKNHDF